MWWALLGAVLLGHAGLGWQLHDIMLGWGDARHSNLARMDVAFVKELVPTTPPTAPALSAPAVPKPPRRKPRTVREPSVAPPEPPASSPEPPAERVVAELQPEIELAPPPVPSAAASAPSVAVASESMSPTAPSAAASVPGVGAFAWPPSTRLTYTLLGNYRGEVHGHARVQWVRRGERYQVHLDVFIGPSFAPLISRRMTSDGRLSDDGLAPERYEEVTKLPFQAARQVRMTFEPGVVTLSGGQNRDALPGVQDTASQFVHLAWLFTARPHELRVGNAITVPLALPRRMDTWIYDVVAQESLPTPVGLVEAFHLKPRRADTRPKGELSAEMWIAPSLQYLPVRIRMQQDADTYADLQLDAAPLQAEPETTR